MSGSDHLYNFLTAAGAGAGALGVGAGAIFAFLFGRRASAAIRAALYETAAGFVISTQPTVKAVGIFRVKFRDQGVVVRLAEVVVDSDGNLVENGNHWEYPGAFDEEYVDPGEELTTTVTFAPTRPEEAVIGWQVYLQISAPTRIGWARTSGWGSQVFVARPVGPNA